MKAVQEMKSAKMLEIRKNLKEFTSNLDAQASSEGREMVPANQLLRECYGIKEGAKLHTYEGWQKRGGQVRKGERALLFWGKPRKSAEHPFCPVVFLFSASQVHFAKEAAI